MKHPPGIYAMAIDGPAEKPNGTILVRILGQGATRFYFRCQVVDVYARLGRLPEIGSMVMIHEGRIRIIWQDQITDVDSNSTPV